MTSRQFIDLIRRKVMASGVTKVVPGKEQLDEAFRLFIRNTRVKAVVESAMAAMTEEAIEVPADLEEQVREALEADPTLSWDEAVKELVDDEE